MFLVIWSRISKWILVLWGPSKLEEWVLVVPGGCGEFWIGRNFGVAENGKVRGPELRAFILRKRKLAKSSESPPCREWVTG